LVALAAEALDIGSRVAKRVRVQRREGGIKHTLVGLSSTGSQIVGLDTLQEILTALGVLNVLNADVEALLDNAVADLLVDNDTNGTRSDVPDNAGTAVVELVGHALVDGTVTLDIDVVSDAEGRQIGAHVRKAMAPEGLGEQVTGLRTLTE
jgi:hypothetical protein